MQLYSKLSSICLILCLILVSCSVVPSYLRLEEVQEWTIPSTWDLEGHAQDVVIEGDYLWFDSGGAIAKYSLYNLNLEDPIVINNHIKENEPLEIDEINGMFIQGNFLYVSATKFLFAKDFWVEWYNKDTLELVGYKEVQNNYSTQEGLSFYNGSWWVTTFNDPVVTKYSQDFTYLKEYKLPGLPWHLSNGQGSTWYESRFLVNFGHSIYIYDFDGSKFCLFETIVIPQVVQNPQGLVTLATSDHNRFYLWIADFYTKPDVDVLHKLEIKEK